MVPLPWPQFYSVVQVPCLVHMCGLLILTLSCTGTRSFRKIIKVLEFCLRVRDREGASGSGKQAGSREAEPRPVRNTVQGFQVSFGVIYVVFSC